MKMTDDVYDHVSRHAPEGTWFVIQQRLVWYEGRSEADARRRYRWASRQGPCLLRQVRHTSFHGLHLTPDDHEGLLLHPEGGAKSALDHMAYEENKGH